MSIYIPALALAFGFSASSSELSSELDSFFAAGFLACAEIILRY